MSGVKAVWHLADMTDDDPFAGTVYSAGVSIDLTAPEEELTRMIDTLLAREEALYKRGLTCDLKWDGQDCRTCPAATLDPEDGRAVLCRLGKDQMAVVHAISTRREESLAPIRDLIAYAEEASEIVPMDALELL